MTDNRDLETQDPASWARSQKTVDASYLLDAERARLSLAEHSAAALRARALAAGNGAQPRE